MEYPFWVNDFNKIKSHVKNYPLASKIFEYPSSFWYGGFRRKSDNWLEGSIKRLLNRGKDSGRSDDQDENINATIIRGSGKAFSAGYDLTKEIKSDMFNP